MSGGRISMREENISCYTDEKNMKSVLEFLGVMMWFISQPKMPQRAGMNSYFSGLCLSEFGRKLLKFQGIPKKGWLVILCSMQT